MPHTTNSNTEGRTAVRVIRSASLRPVPWRNGLGTTYPIHAEATWQISVADLSGDVAFSVFAGQDRVFTLIKGDGAQLELLGCPSLQCRLLVPALFSGDVRAHYRPVGGPGQAFNVISMRGAARPRVQVASLVGLHVVPSDVVAIFCAEGRLEVGGEVLEAGDTALNPTPGVIDAATGGVAILVLLQAADDALTR